MKGLCRLSQPNKAMEFHPNDVTAMPSSNFFSSTFIRATHFTIKLYSTKFIMVFFCVSVAGITREERTSAKCFLHQLKVITMSVK